MELKHPLPAAMPVVAACLLFACDRALVGAELDPALAEAQRELFAARYENAVTLYSKIVEQRPAEADAWYGLVRAQLGSHHSREAYTAAGQALDKAPQTAGAETAAGLAMYRRGDLPKAEAHYQAALKIKRDYPGALRGMESSCSRVPVTCD
jgi:tetratricopeptide (TPR) repeat protein